MRSLLLCVVLASSLLVACGRDGAPRQVLAKSEARATLTDRNWLDRWPTDEHERLQVYRFTPAMGGGVFQDRTLFQGHFELFTFAIDGDQVRIRWPGRGLDESIRYRIERVDGPRPFDLRLVLDGNRVGPHVLFGRSAEGQGDDATVAVERALAR
jgi:hypothetical protein